MMKRCYLILTICCILLSAGSGGPASGDQKSGVIYLVEAEDTIQPASAQYIVSSINRADEENAVLLIIRLNTPGGLSTSTDQITAAMLNCDTPIAVFIAPYGAKAASAGMMITISADIAAMAPGTNIGAAAAVSLPMPTGPLSTGDDKDDKTDDVMSKKIEEDAVAHWTSIAGKRGRNIRMVEDAIREASSYTENEALEGGLVELICHDTDELLEALDNREIRRFSGETVMLKTAGTRLVIREMTTRQKLLSVLSNPNLIMIFFGLGLLGMYFEFSNPGLILPGVVGGICLILAFFGLQVLPINYAGLALIILSLIFFIVEVKVTSYGLLTVAGIISMILGSIMLFETPIPELRVSLSVIIPVALTVGAVTAFLLHLVLKAQKRKAVTGSQGLIGREGKCVTDIAPEGKVFLHGEIWDAVSGETIHKGEKIVVTHLDGLTMKVKKKK